MKDYEKIFKDKIRRAAKDNETLEYEIVSGVIVAVEELAKGLTNHGSDNEKIRHFIKVLSDTRLHLEGVRPIEEL